MITYLSDAVNNTLVALDIEERPIQEEIERVQLARAVELFDKRFDIELEKESAVVNIFFENKDAGITAKTLDTFLSMYLEKRKFIYIEPRIELARTEMEASHKHALAAGLAGEKFKIQHKLYSLEDEREGLLERRDKALEESSLLFNAGLEKKYNRLQSPA